MTPTSRRSFLRSLLTTAAAVSLAPIASVIPPEPTSDELLDLLFRRCLDAHRQMIANMQAKLYASTPGGVASLLESQTLNPHVDFWMRQLAAEIVYKSQ